MELATQLTNPFGKDDTDFPLQRWVMEMRENAVVLVESEYPGEQVKYKVVGENTELLDFLHMQDVLSEMEKFQEAGLSMEQVKATLEKMNQNKRSRSRDEG